MDTNQFGSAFWLTMSGILMSALGAVGYYMAKSKCVECRVCWGLVSIRRDVQAENDCEQIELEHGINPQSPLMNQSSLGHP